MSQRGCAAVVQFLCFASLLKACFGLSVVEFVELLNGNNGRKPQRSNDRLAAHCDHLSHFSFLVMPLFGFILLPYCFREQLVKPTYILLVY